MPRCIYWVRPRLGGCPMPKPSDIGILRSNRVTLLVSLAEDGEFYDYWEGGPEEFLARMEEAGIRVYRLPTPDFGTPDPDEACKALREARAEIERGGRVVFHCYGGIGRTGTMLAAYLAWAECLDPLEAIEEVARFGAGPQTPEQREMVYLLPKVCGGCTGGRETR